MAKTKSVYVCQNCGAESVKWLGRCPSCGEWNTYVEERITKETSSRPGLVNVSRNAIPTPIREIDSDNELRVDTKIGELNRILGGGIVPGSVILLGGEPGIGKSTLALQLALGLKSQKVLYISGEESARQVKLRADRINHDSQDCLILNETLLENILTQTERVCPELVVIDSIQTLYTDTIESSPGSVSQVRETAAALLRYAKTSGTPVILIGHITKDGSIAGPKVLEHIVDVVLQFEGDQNYLYRILRSAKNRFGSTSEIGIFEMQSGGLVEVTNPSEILLSHREEMLSGIAVAATIDGARPFLIETQALVSTAVYGTPQRSTTGFDPRRLNMLLAVLERRAGFRLANKDVFLNIAGGLRVNDPAIDLAIISAILSSTFDVAIAGSTCFAAEVGLSGEIRPVSRLDQRIAEAAKLGMSRAFVSKYNLKKSDVHPKGIEVIPLGRIEELVKALFGRSSGRQQQADS
ncbi:MAG: DNA repair protein RadA [Bacteroidales bacterium]|jgi:DNA repair protein RadA/Sms|nr:DNA repair protein RadA [Bacteroidales bacterium]HNT41335.1 DNA repair protein RadA [Tenuifilaceae bacterium]MBP8644354.1 DNA repair protein RadA [Bacteroidales bacterium]NLI86728.1 DNA repair protein RadA [Bacteroidales bacterium]HOA10488.1 DNA repair protein RadA [Tenuifilaceae bacterium]